MLARRLFAPLLALCSIGCVAFQDCEYRATQHCRAHCAWWTSCDRPCSCDSWIHCPWSHYSYGWRQGYQDVLSGSDGTCPPVPPHCYWSPKLQNEAGEQAIERWFQGYGDGAQAGLASCRGRYHPVPLSNEFRQYGPCCISPDMGPYNYGKTILGVGVPRAEAGDQPAKPDKSSEETIELKPEVIQPTGCIQEDSGDKPTKASDDVPPSPAVSSRWNSKALYQRWMKPVSLQKTSRASMPVFKHADLKQ